jgi:hypothetical protein
MVLIKDYQPVGEEPPRTKASPNHALHLGPDQTKYRREREALFKSFTSFIN